MKIWVIGRSYPLKKNKMRGSFELEQSTILAKRGHQVTYIACVFHPLNKVKKWGYMTWEENGLRVCTYSQFYTLERFKFRWKRLQEKRWRELLLHAEETGGLPDVIHIHYPAMITEPDIIFEYKKRGVKLVVTEHWSHTLINSLDKHEHDQLCFYAENADRFICVGEPLKEAVYNITGIDCYIDVIPNVVSDYFKPSNISNDKELFCFVAMGRLAPPKQFDGIIKAFAMSFKGNENVTLKIVGGGTLLREFKKLSNNLGVSKQIEFTGTLSRKEVAVKLSNSDCLICFSRLETFGVPVIEAWSCGIPAIASDSLGFLEYYNEKLGYIVSHDSVEKLADAMKSIEANYERYSREYISKFANDNFGEEAIYKKIIDVYTR